MFSDAAAHIGFVDEQSVDTGAAHCIGAVTQNHPCGAPDAIDSEAEGLKTFLRREDTVEPFQCPEWVVAFTDGTEADTGGTHARLDVRNAEDDDFVTASLQPAGECRHRVDVA